MPFLYPFAVRLEAFFLSACKVYASGVRKPPDGKITGWTERRAGEEGRSLVVPGQCELSQACAKQLGSTLHEIISIQGQRRRWSYDDPISQVRTCET